MRYEAPENRACGTGCPSRLFIILTSPPTIVLCSRSGSPVRLTGWCCSSNEPRRIRRPKVRNTVGTHNGKVSSECVVISTYRLNDQEMKCSLSSMRVGMGTLYQDNSLIMVSLNRPLPGVRLGELRKCCQEQGTHSRA
jgi:hypothetical protein